MRNSSNNINFHDSQRVCKYYFGEGSQTGSHITFTTHVLSARIAIQNNNGKAKAYQVIQALKRINKSGD